MGLLDVHEECVCPVHTGSDLLANQWIRDNFEDCIYTPLELVAFSLGLLSLICWVCAQAPQFITNCKHKSVEALEPLFIFQWFGGDTSNLLGAILTQQLPNQILTGMMFLLIDTVMVCQLLYYSSQASSEGSEEESQFLLSGAVKPLPGKIKLRKPSPESKTSNKDRYGSTTRSILAFMEASKLSSEDEQDEEDGYVHEATRSTQRKSILSKSSKPRGSMAKSVRFLGLVTCLLLFSLSSSSRNSDNSFDVTTTNRVLLAEYHDDRHRICNDQQVAVWEERTGYCLGLISGFLYLNARFAQIGRNKRRQTAAGLSWFMFLMAILGNLTYGFSILLRVTELSEVLHTLPWLIGSIGTLLLDFIILGQYFFYNLTIEKREKHLTDSPILTYLVHNREQRVQRGIHNIFA